MNRKRRLYFSIFWIILGFGLNLGYFAGLLEEYWQSMGVAFLVVGALQLLRHLRYRTDEAYREKVDINEQDERNKFLANKAWAWAGYWYVLLAALGTVVFKIMGQEDLMMFCSFSVCAILLLYWLSYRHLQKKY